MRRKTETQIKKMAKNMVHTFHEDRSVDYLFSLLAPDVFYLGGGKNVQAEGRKKVEFFLKKIVSYMYPGTVTRENYITKRIGLDHWLCEMVCDLELQKSETEILQEGLHASVLFRRVKDVAPGQNEWEIIHLHKSLTTSLLPSDDMLQIQQASKNRKKPHIYQGMTDKEIKLVRMLRSGMPIRDMAQEFGQAEITIKKALAKLYHRYDKKNRSRLCAYFDELEHNY